MRFRKFTPHPVACYGDTTGYMSLMFYGGLLPYDIDLYWVEGDEFIEEGWGIHEDYANLSAGNYNVTVIDAEGNSISQTVVITQPDAISVDVISVTDPMCNGENTGYVVLGFTGGTPFTDADKPYFWLVGTAIPLERQWQTLCLTSEQVRIFSPLPMPTGVHTPWSKR